MYSSIILLQIKGSFLSQNISSNTKQILIIWLLVRIMLIRSGPPNAKNTGKRCQSSLACVLLTKGFLLDKKQS
jgi:hypothetical protein